MLNNFRRAAEKLLAPYGKVTYSQAGEDMSLDFLVNYAPTGFYVDVGCNHPLNGSNTYRFYRKGWKGLAIDGNPKFGPLFHKHRAKDRFIHAVVSDCEKPVSFHIFAADALSSISGTPLYTNTEQYKLERVDHLTTRTLTSILREAGAPADFEILSVDTEGHDEQVLRSLDFSFYRPKVILTETNGIEGPLERSELSKIILSQGYRLVAKTWANVFYTRF